MYTVYLDDELLYYPEDEELVIINSKLDQALNECGSFEFDIPHTHALYDSFDLRKSMVTIYKDDVEIFNGEVREVTPTMNFCKHVYVVGELAFLFDSIQPQAKYQNYTPLQLFTALINQHNSQVENRKRFTVGMVTVTDPNNSLYRFTNYEDTLTALREKMCDKLDGYLRIRKVSGTRYIDLVKLPDYGNVCDQQIEFGENLLDYSCNMNAQDIATAVVPLGEKLEESVVEGLDAYLTIEGATGTPTNSVHPSGANYIYNSTAVSNYGYVKVVKKWDGITIANNLLSAADEWLTSAQYETMTLEINAFDQSTIDADIESYEIGDYVIATAEPFGMTATAFPVQKKTTYLQDASKNYVVLGNKMQKSYTKQASEAVALVEAELPEESSILQAAKQNAINILTGTEGGYLIFGFNASGQIESLSIMNASTEASATKKWVWNLGGFGYLYRAQVSDSWTNLGPAMTMDGAIVADFITTGQMFADRIRGGILYLGGSAQGAYKNGSIKIYNSSNTEIGSWSSSGLTVKSGTITLGSKTSLTDANSGVYIGSNGIALGASSKFKVTDSGALTASDAAISGTITVGGNNNTKGAIYVQDGSNVNKVTLNNSGIAIQSGSIKLGSKNSLTDANSGLYLASDGIALGASSVFKVTNDGALTATNATINGNITVGGSGNGKGAIYVQNGSNVNKVTLNNDGIAIQSGTINLGNKTSLTDANSGVYIASDGIALGPSSRFTVTNAGRVHIKTQGTSSEEDYLVIEDPGGNKTYIGGEYIYTTGAAESIRIADLINYYIDHR